MPAANPARFPLRFRDHARFHRVARVLALAGAIAGAAGSALAAVGVDVAAALDHLSGFAVVAIGVSIGAIALREPVVGGRGAMRAVGVAGAAAAALVGAWSVETLAAASALATAVPAPIFSAALGAGLGLIVAVGTSPAHLRSARDPVAAALASERAQSTGELAEMSQRSHASYIAARDAAEGASGGYAPDLGDRIETLGQYLARLLARCRALDEAAGPHAGARLSERRDELTARLKSARDPAARAYYERACASVEAQLEQIGRMHTCRERAAALLHDKIALLDRARLSVLGLGAPEREGGVFEESAVAEELDRAAAELEAETIADTDVHTDTDLS